MKKDKEHVVKHYHLLPNNSDCGCFAFLSICIISTAVIRVFQILYGG